jgi:hypothetical protein
VIRFSKWAVLAAALAAVVAFLDNIGKFLHLTEHLPLPDWTFVLAQYKLEAAAIVVLSVFALTINWEVIGEKYGGYRSLWLGPAIRIRSHTIFTEEALLLLALLSFASVFLHFEFQKARTLYTSYGFAYLVKTRCDGDFVAARDRADALTKIQLWNRYVLDKK